MTGDLPSNRIETPRIEDSRAGSYRGFSGVIDAVLFVAILGFSAVALLAFALAAPLAIAITSILAAASALTATEGRRGGWRTVGAV